MSFMDSFLNIGALQDDDANHIRLIRQLNGLNMFYAVICISIVFLCFFLFIRSASTFYMIIIQIIAAILYLVNIILVKSKKIALARSLTINIFEWHIFTAIVLSNSYMSPLLMMVIIYPLLAALVEGSIIKHLLIGILQVAILYFIKFFFPNIDHIISSMSVFTPQTAGIARVLSFIYIPVMAAVIIFLIYRENILAREKQKELLNQITSSNIKLANLTNELKDEAWRLRAEVEIGRKLQTMLLPTEKELSEIKDLDISGSMRTADEVGGDYYDVFKINDVVIIGIGDVTGHGLPSGIIMLMAQTAIRSLAEVLNRDITSILKILNSILYTNIHAYKRRQEHDPGIDSLRKRCFFSIGPALNRSLSAGIQVRLKKLIR